MKRLISAALLACLPGLHAADITAEARKDVQLRAMLDELARAKTLQLNNLDKPYFIEYDSGDSQQVVISASLGGLLASGHERFRSPRIQVRVGDYKSDNTNTIFSGSSHVGMLTIDDDYPVLRTEFWLATDGMYKAAADQMTRKRNALREVADPDKTPDFSSAPLSLVLEKVPPLELDQANWEGILRRVSSQFAVHPALRSSGVSLRVIASTYRLVNTEGTIIRVPQNLNAITVRAQSQAGDGSYIWNHVSFTPARPGQLPDEKTLAKSVDAIANETDALAKAPIAEDFSGPVLFEQEAAAQMMASVLNDAVRLHRKPLTPQGAEAPQILESVWASKVGSKVLPDWLSLVDDPTVNTTQSVDLAGAYSVDDEGVKAQKVTLVDRGTLKGFLNSRQPVRDTDSSNGHGRLPGGFGAQAGVIGNLFVEAQGAIPEAQMKAKLIAKVKASGAKFGMIIRRIDFPFTSDFDELQSIARQLQKNGYARTLSSPILAYRVFPDGREELVRGLRFKEFSAKDLRDIDAVSDHRYVFNYINNGSGFNFADVSSEATTSSVICPSLLFDNLELARAENEPGKQPLVTAPALVAGR